MKPRVYVATAFKNLEEAKAVMESLSKIGFEITHDWTNESSEGKQGEELEKYLTMCAVHDLQGVETADLVFLVNDPRAKGAFTEFGIALGCRIPVIVAKKNVAQNIFFHVGIQLDNEVFVYETVEEAMAHARKFHKRFVENEGYRPEVA
jgi:hypothetical protein